MATEDLILAAEFPAADKAQWQQLVARVLHSPAGVETPEQELITETLDGIGILPLYEAADMPGWPGFPGLAPFVRGRTAAGHRAGWDVRQLQGNPDPAVAGPQVLEDLEGGASSVWLQLGPGATPIESLPQVLAEVYLDLAPVVLDAGEQARTAAEAFLGYALGRVAEDQLQGVLGIDPLGLLARTGADAGMGDAVELAQRCVRELPLVRAVVVDALPFHEAGGTDVEELGASLAAGVAYLRALTEAGMDTVAALGQLEFRYAASADQFATIAKFRAARRLWARVAQSCGAGDDPAAGQRQHAVTSWSMTTRRDPWNNILRATLACMSAGVGGADAITVLPFDAALGLPDALARRVARNTHALLAEESNLARVIDPAGGSFYVESLTEELARHAWAWFQEIERAGGLAAALRSGLVGDRIAVSREARRSALAHRAEAVTGVSEFPLLGEALLSREPGGLTDRPGGGLPRVRWGQWHESLRDRADAHQAKTGKPPTAVLVAVGPARGAAARVDAVTALLAPAGIVGATGPAAPGSVVCLCCAADASAEEVAAAVREARGAGAARVVLAGPAELKAEVDDVVGDDSDVLAWQSLTLDALGVE